MPLDASAGALARAARAFYLLRTLRVFRYLDLQSMMYSPTYGMVVSLIVLLSFFAQGLALWVIVIFFAAELVMRAVLLRGMRFAGRREKAVEWFYWWVDFLATFAMIPIFATARYGAALRMLRLIRLLRPWLVIVRNLRSVIKEGQYVQEINLIVLLIAILSIGAGVVGRLFLPDYDYTRDGIVNEQDRTLLAPIWFAFRLLSDPGNTVFFPEHPAIAVFSVLAPIIGLFLLAFFIGIGANIVSGLMKRLRNEPVNIANHMVMIGWNEVAPFILDHLRLFAERFHVGLKLVLLHERGQAQGQAQEGWIIRREGDTESEESLRRVNLRHARQAVLLAPGTSTRDQFAWSIASLVAARRENPDIYLTFALAGDTRPRLDTHRHPFQIGWDRDDFYDKPTVVFSLADARASLLRNVLAYRDFDQIMHRLIAPQRVEESFLQVCEFDGRIVFVEGSCVLEDEKGIKASLTAMAARMFRQGAVLLGVIPDGCDPVPLYAASHLPAGTPIRGLLGLAVSPSALLSEARFAIEHPLPIPRTQELPNLSSFPAPRVLNLLILGWVDGMPLFVKRLAQSFDALDITILDDLEESAIREQTQYLRRRIAETPEIAEKCQISYQRWDFHHMEALRPHVRRANRIIVARPLRFQGTSYAIVVSTLAHLYALLEEEGLKTQVFPILEDRQQARLLQEELADRVPDSEVHVVVPDEFFGAFVAHTSFHMFAAETSSAYEMQRRLRHAVDDLMGDVGENDQMEIGALVVNELLPADAEKLFCALLERGMIWIGYRMRADFVYSDPVYGWLQRLFPRKYDFQCLRQRQIVLNPFGSPLTRHSWTHMRHEIAELIVVRASSP
ncbi:MAG: hypothetical protein D6771_09290 [Zetaproteobacteria bacterium]|nr:MAG: hypothetical protein D6771_09290 [Zetaproteobacteria bacterium]